MRLKDARRLNGLLMNVTDADGTTVFSTVGDAEHEGFDGVKGNISITAKPHHAVLKGRLSFTVPGPDDADENGTEVTGTWIYVSRGVAQTEHEDEVQAFHELHEAMLAKAKEPVADIFESYMQMRNGA
ncbi:uncharacterized protein LTR77_010395 [Saxophila tyrrhenica]|uniref:Uncharacterized protein n=1 Tax=Saxophila tyrrhenica TaxID=1690608 RepID=A0AAV9NWA2_9PEZI|nr:hypothetical protein LTR77_010395 [Saxophila tyrrhenica]